MKIPSFLLFILFLLTSINHTKAAWEKLFDAGINTADRFISFDNIIIVASDSGVYRSTDSGKSWTFSIIDKIKTPDNTVIPITATMFCKNEMYIFASTGSGVYASDDTGRTWKPKGPSPDGRHLWLMSVFAKGSYIFTTMAGGGVFRSSDNGISWSYLGPHRFYKYIEHQDKLFAAAMDGLWFSSDLGKTWMLCPQFDISPRYISVFSLTHNNKYIFADCWDKIYRSDDGGVTIQNISNGLPFPEYNLCGIFSAGKLLFAGFTNKRIYFSKDDGEHWNDISEGLDTLDNVNCFGLCGEKLLISKSKGLWSYDLSLLTEVKGQPFKNQAKYELSQNYPNPFNPSTLISYSIPEGCYVRLKIFDILGNEISVLVNEFKETGSHIVQFSGTDIPSGVYICTLEAGNFRVSKKIMLIK